MQLAKEVIPPKGMPSSHLCFRCRELSHFQLDGAAEEPSSSLVAVRVCKYALFKLN